MAQLQAQDGDVLLRHANGRFVVVRSGMMFTISFRGETPVVHSPREISLEDMQSAGWSEVSITTDLTLVDEPMVWPEPPMDPPPPPPEE